MSNTIKRNIKNNREKLEQILFSMTNLICIRQLKKLLKEGYIYVGEYGRNNNYIYIKRLNDKVASPFCLNDFTFN